MSNKPIQLESNRTDQVVGQLRSVCNLFMRM